MVVPVTAVPLALVQEPPVQYCRDQPEATLGFSMQTLAVAPEGGLVGGGNWTRTSA